MHNLLYLKKLIAIKMQTGMFEMGIVEFSLNQFTIAERAMNEPKYIPIWAILIESSRLLDPVNS